MPVPLGDLSLGLGVLVLNLHVGIIRYIGKTRFAGGDWVGVELGRPLGKNDGSVQGFRYFQCAPNHGLFVKPQDIELYEEKMTPSKSPRPGGVEYQTQSEQETAPPAVGHSVVSSVEEISQPDGTRIRKIIKKTTMKYETPAENEKIPKSNSAIAQSLNRALQRRSSIPELQKSGILLPKEFQTPSRSHPSASNSPSPIVKSFGVVEPAHRRLWLWGDNQHGELGTGDEITQRTPIEVKLKGRGIEIAQFALGLNHSVCLSLDNEVFTCGSWISGLLGHSERNNIHRLKKLKQFELLKKEQPRNPIICVACSDRHSVALHASGELYTWGGTLYGKLGRTGSDAAESATTGNYFLVTALQGKRVTNVDCGIWHTAVCTDEGEVFTFGGGGKFFNRGQLGVSDHEDSMVPRKIERFGSQKIYIRDICCGGYHTLALSSSRQVWSWGRGDFGQLGLGSDTNESEPRLVEALVKVGRCLALAAGENHSLACMESGEVYSWGYGMQGQLGHGLGRGNERLPKKIKFFSERNIACVQVAAGWRHSISLSGDQKVFTWGHGDKGQLGHGDLKSQPVPKQVMEIDGEEIRQISAGGSHSLAFNAYFKAAQEMVVIQKLRQEKANPESTKKQMEKIEEKENEINQKGENEQEEREKEEENEPNFHESDQSAYETVKREEEENGDGDAAAADVAGSLAESSVSVPLGLSIDLVYSPQVRLVHRFLSFQTSEPRATFEPAIRSFLADQYSKDSGLLFDQLTISPGNLVLQARLGKYEMNQRRWAIYEPEDGPARVCLMIVTKTVDYEENLWPSWADLFYRKLVLACPDIAIDPAKHRNENSNAGFPTVTETEELFQRLPCCFRELRPKEVLDTIQAMKAEAGEKY